MAKFRMKGNGNMSSVNFEKIKQNGKPVSSYLRHNDTEERLKHEHQNTDINKELTHNNLDCIRRRSTLRLYGQNHGTTQIRAESPMRS